MIEASRLISKHEPIEQGIVMKYLKYLKRKKSLKRRLSKHYTDGGASASINSTRL
jgi:hypothetical protein